MSGRSQNRNSIDFTCVILEIYRELLADRPVEDSLHYLNVVPRQGRYILGVSIILHSLDPMLRDFDFEDILTLTE